MSRIDLKSLRKREALGIQTLITSLLFTGLVGCTFGGPKKKSILVIAVEGLAFDSFSCDSNLGQPEKAHGFRAFCEEAVRFTHAYTPSPLSTPAVASILTGQFPVEHGLKDNGKSFLPGRALSVAEVALEQGYRTAFFSSGPPILYKSGLAQGFEVFRNAVKLHSGVRHRSAEKIFTDTNQWFQESAEDKHLAFVYLSDLQYPDKVTKTNEGEIRSQTTASQLSEIDESLGSFIESLKRAGRWDSSLVVLVGLNGGLLDRENREERGVSLYSENVQIKLFIKPSRKKRDKGLQWKVDQYVSLADLGETLFDFLGESRKSRSQFGTISLKKVTESLENELPEKRMIPIESSWSSWRNTGVPRLSVRMDQYLYIYDKRTKFYNTIYDRDERSQIDLKDPLALDSLEEIERFVKQMPYQRWRPMASTFREKLVLSRNLFSSKATRTDIVRSLIHISNHRSWDDQVWGWRAKLAIESRNWEDLLKIGKDQGVLAWRLVAALNLGMKLEDDELSHLKGCDIYLFDPSRKYDPQLCDDELLRLFVLWSGADNNQDSDKRMERFLRLFRSEILDKQIYQLNYLNGLTWSTDIMTYSNPSHTELALALPSFRGLANKVKKRIAKRDGFF